MNPKSAMLSLAASVATAILVGRSLVASAFVAHLPRTAAVVGRRAPPIIICWAGSDNEDDAHQDDGSATSLSLPALIKPIQKLKEIDFQQGTIFQNKPPKATRNQRIKAVKDAMPHFDFPSYANNFVKLLQGNEQKKNMKSWMPKRIYSENYEMYYP